MNPGLMLRAARELWPVTALIGAALLVIETVLSYVLPTFQQEFASEFLQIRFIQQIVSALVGTDISQGMGPEIFITVCWVHPVVLALVWTHAIVICTRVPAGEVDRGTIDVLLALPVSRWRLFVSETGAWVISGVAVLGAAWGGHLIGTSLVDAETRPDQTRVAAVILNLLTMYLAVGALAWLCSALSDRRGRAMTVVFALVVVSFLLNYLAPFWWVADRLSFLGVLNYHRPVFVFRDGTWPVADLIVLCGSALLLWGAAGVTFARRDLSTT